MQNTKYIALFFIIGVIAGSIGSYTVISSCNQDGITYHNSTIIYEVQTTSEFHDWNAHFLVGDKVQTTDEWNKFYEPMNGNVTDVYEYKGDYLIRIDGGRRINEYWIEEM